LADDEIREYLSAEEIAEIFSFERYLQHVDFIFQRVGI
jgi:adenylosuccinate lyase